MLFVHPKADCKEAHAPEVNLTGIVIGCADWRRNNVDEFNDASILTFGNSEAECTSVASLMLKTMYVIQYDAWDAA